MKSKLLNFKEDISCSRFKEEYENGQELQLKKDNYIIKAGEYFYIDNGRIYELTNLYFDKNDFQKYLDNNDVVKINSNAFHLYRVNNSINVKAIKECLSPHITSYNLAEDTYVEFNPSNIELYL